MLKPESFPTWNEVQERFLEKLTSTDLVKLVQDTNAALELEADAKGLDAYYTAFHELTKVFKGQTMKFVLTHLYNAGLETSS